MKWIKEHKQILIISVIILVLLIGISYAWLRLVVEGEKQINLKGGELSLVLEETSNGINLTPTLPLTDDEGMEGEAFTFYIQNNSNTSVNYELKLVDNKEKKKECGECTFIKDEDIRYQIIKSKSKTKIDNLDDTRVIDTGYISNGTSNRVDYTLRIWLDIDAGNDEMNAVFYGKLEVEAVQTPTSDIPNEPVLSDNMIPVLYNEQERRWEKADKTGEWYNYSKQEWANVVITTQETREGYKSADTGEEIKMSDILQMYVWIPRYSYTIQGQYGKGGESAPSPGEIDIKFIPESKKEKGEATYNGDEAKEWFTPPGFTFGKEELSGIWVGKFETGYSGAQNTSAAQVDTESSDKVIIKPNVYSWRSIRVSTLDLVARGMNDSGNIYGFEESTIDTHAMKNSEWALITYLTQSKYGKYGNDLYNGANKEVYINNYSGYMTGCSSGVPTASSTNICVNKYDIISDRGSGTGEAGGGASSTGNITGIYDVNGGAWEYMMGSYNKYSGYTSKSYSAEESETLGRPKADGEAGLWNSGYTGMCGLDNKQYTGREWPEDKYYDLYTTNNALTACNGPCKGHALGEVAGWYSDTSDMVRAQNPWFTRGGGRYNGEIAGVFDFSGTYGYANINHSFRIVLAP